MSALTLSASAPKTMSSREIAALVELRHDNVRRTIETLGVKGVITLPQSEEVSNDGPGPKTISVYRVGKRDSFVVVAQLSPEFTARLVDRWQELEQRALQPQVPQTMPEALRLAADALEAQAKAEAQLALAAPKVEFADAVLNADGTILVRDAAKTIGVPVRKLERALREKGVILLSNAPAAQYVERGYFKEAVHTFEKPNGETVLCVTARVTGLGIEFIRRFAARHAALLMPSRREERQAVLV